ncbi:GGDEF domain-containing protein [Thermodesulfovibrio sp.]|uniref:GGDEF domain-containing protein n=1 Tax=Thermodesulfovibrio sp. TaxID=2067987 RepID=UPI003C7CA2C1
MISGKNFLSLKELYIGETAEIVYIDRNIPLAKKLRDMGVREGVLIELISFDPLLNKKVVLKVADSYLAFDAEIAEFIRVRPIRSWYNFYKEQAFYDSLTGCLNKNAASLVLPAEYEKVTNIKIPLSIILIDIDDFKKINDLYGHAFGDRVLSELGSMLRKNVRRTDIVFRWGGEEFLILMKGLNVESSYVVTERLRECAQCLDIPPHGKVIKISAGVDGVPPYVPMNELIERVDKALYAAKSRGKNRVCTFFWKMSHEAT